MNAQRLNSLRKAFWSLAQPRILVPAFITLAGLLSGVAEPSKDGLPQQPGQLFQLTNVWTVHLRFAPEQWKAMEPSAPTRGPFGGGGGPRGPGGFGPGMFLAPAFLDQGDQDRDGKLSQAEFTALAEKWFSAWDQNKTGKLNVSQLGVGLSSVIGPPNFGPPGGQGPGPGPERLGRRGPGPGMNLQGEEGKRNGLSSAAGIEFEYVHADLEFAGQLLRDVAVRYKGNGTFMQSRGSLKRSLKVELNKYIKGQKLAGISKLNFHNNVTDASWMNEVLSHRLFRDAGVPAPRTSYARVFVTVPGTFDKEYFGLYSMVEDVDTHFAEHNFSSAKGAIFKPVTPHLFADLGSEWKSYNQTYDPKTDLRPEQKQRVIDFCKLVSKADDAEFGRKASGYVDLEEFARFMAVTVWLSTMDSILGPGQNYYLYLQPKTKQFQFVPWDLDHSFGQFGLMGSQDQRENLSIHHPWRGENRFLERMFKLESFKKLYLARLTEFSETVFKPGRFEQQVNEIAAAIRPAISEESQSMLARFDKVVAGEAAGPPGFGGPRDVLRGGPDGGGGEGPGGRFGGGPGGFGEPAKPIKAFVKVRAQSVKDQLAGKTEGQTPGEFGFGGRGGHGGPGRGGQGEFGPGNFIARSFMASLDANQDDELTREEFTRGFAKWFESWNIEKSGSLSEEELRSGINHELRPLGGPPPDGRP